MPQIDFTLVLAPVIEGGVRALVILILAFTARVITKRAIHKVITAQMPKIREESQDQLALRSETSAHVIGQLVTVTIWTFAVIMILGEVGLSIAPLLAALGLASLALGFAAQNIIRDYVNEFFIILKSWYRVGEWAIVTDKGGLVEDISLRRTVLRNLTGAVHFIPNSKIEIATNLTPDFDRINLNVSVGYGENLDRVVDVTNDVYKHLKDDPVLGPDLLTTPNVVRVDKLGDSGIEIKSSVKARLGSSWPLLGSFASVSKIILTWRQLKYRGLTPRSTLGINLAATRACTTRTPIYLNQLRNGVELTKVMLRLARVCYGNYLPSEPLDWQKSMPMPYNGQQ
jgi:small-conductance mechanosensitive channel